MSWEMVRISTFLKVRENRYKAEDPIIGNLKRIEKIDFNGRIVLSNKPSKTDMILVKKGDFVISGINVEKGAMAVYEGEEDITATIHYSSYQVDEKKVDIDFLKFFLKSDEFTNALKEQVPGGIKTEIKPKHLLPLIVQIPNDLSIQRNIVGKLKRENIRFKTLLSELTHQRALLTRLRQSILQDAVQGRLTAQWRQAHPNQEPASELLRRIREEKAAAGKKEKPLPPVTEQEKPFELPEGWVWCRLREVVEYTEAGKSPNCKNEPAKPEEWGVLKTTAIQALVFLPHENKVLPKGYIVNTSQIVKEGDLLITRAGPKNRVGIVCFVEKLRQNLILSDKTIRIKYFDKFIDGKFLSISLYCQQTQEFLFSKMVGMADSQVNISQDNIQRSPIPLPPLSEQTAIVARVEAMLERVSALEAESARQRAWAEGLLQAALREAMGG